MSSPALPRPTALIKTAEQQLEELDQLIQRMLTIPISSAELEIAEPAAAEQNSGSALAPSPVAVTQAAETADVEQIIRSPEAYSQPKNILPEFGPITIAPAPAGFLESVGEVSPRPGTPGREVGDEGLLPLKLRPAHPNLSPPSTVERGFSDSLDALTPTAGAIENQSHSQRLTASKKSAAQQNNVDSIPNTAESVAFASEPHSLVNTVLDSSWFGWLGVLLIAGAATWAVVDWFIWNW